jgi:hypothetical protein
MTTLGIENPCVGGSIPPQATKCKRAVFRRPFFYILQTLLKTVSHGYRQNGRPEFDIRSANNAKRVSG